MTHNKVLGQQTRSMPLSIISYLALFELLVWPREVDHAPGPMATMATTLSFY